MHERKKARKMPKPKVANLSPGLVAVKGAATPPLDAPVRSAADAATSGSKADEQASSREEIVPLNFRVTTSFRRAFKTYAASHDMKLNHLLRVAFDAYRKQEGD